jgi:uncharacterized NAD-dependent epimerase/dehydratase family protein
MSGTPTDSLRVPFDELNGLGVRVAVVDTGIDASHPDVGSVGYGVHLKLGRDGEVMSELDYTDDYGHGTALAGIIRRLAPCCELVAVKISSGSNPIAPHLLAAGIDWAVRLGVDVINVSAGTTGTSDISTLADCCRRACEARVVVVASESNDKQISYPSAFDSVLTVRGDVQEHQKYAFRCDPSLPWRFCCYGGYQRVAWVKPRFLFLHGNSFAAAHLTGIVALVLQKFGRLPQKRLLRTLYHNAINAAAESWTAVRRNSTHNPIKTSVDWIRKAALYPYAKEMHGLVRFRHLLPFELVGIADPVARGCAGKDAGEVLNLPATGLRVTGRFEEALANADTLILGFTSRLGALHQRDFRGELARRAIELGKNVYSFEPLLQPHHAPLLLEAARRGLRLSWPGVEEVHLADLREAATVPADYSRIPILGVFGTSPSQGKFTLQLLLREQLRLRGVTVAQVGTEHQSELFGMEDCFPIGHVNNVSLRGYFWREYFRLRYQQIARNTRPDLIIVGSQGGVVPYTLRSQDEGSLSHMNLLFLMAVRADSYILVVNHLDTVHFIRDTLDALRIIGKGRPILLALSNRKRRIVQSFGRSLVAAEPVAPREQFEHLCRLEHQFNLPAVSILDEQRPNRLINAVMEAYT